MLNDCTISRDEKIEGGGGGFDLGKEFCYFDRVKELVNLKILRSSSDIFPITSFQLPTADFSLSDRILLVIISFIRSVRSPNIWSPLYKFSRSIASELYSL